MYGRHMSVLSDFRILTCIEELKKSISAFILFSLMVIDSHSAREHFCEIKVRSDRGRENIAGDSDGDGDGSILATQSSCS